MRDIITHHYFDIDSEMVFVVCSEHIPEMKKAFWTICRIRELGDDRFAMEMEKLLGMKLTALPKGKPRKTK